MWSMEIKSQKEPREPWEKYQIFQIKNIWGMYQPFNGDWVLGEDIKVFIEKKVYTKTKCIAVHPINDM